MNTEPLFFASATATGSRHITDGLDNQDRVFAGRVGDDYLFCIWDGISAFGKSGGAAPEIARSLVEEEVSRFDMVSCEDPRSFLIGLLREAQGRVLRELPSDGRPLMGTTMTAVYIQSASRLVHIAHVGNSPVFLTTSGNLEKITIDDVDIFSKGALCRWIGNPAGLDEKTLYSCAQVAEGDVVLLCSDGLSSTILGHGESVLSEVLSASDSIDLEKRIKVLVDKASLADGDDASLIAVRITGDAHPGAYLAESDIPSIPAGASMTDTPKTTGAPFPAKLYTMAVQLLISFIIGFVIGFIIGFAIGCFVAPRINPDATPATAKEASLPTLPEDSFPAVPDTISLVNTTDSL